MTQRQIAFAKKTETSDLIIFAVRSWVRAQVSGLDSDKGTWHNMAWQSCMGSIGSEAASRGLESFLNLLTRNIREPFRLGCMCCGRVSDDEKYLVEIVAALQDCDLTRAQERLSKWFDDAQAWQAETIIEGFADQLFIHGFMVEHTASHVYSSTWVDRPRAH